MTHRDPLAPRPSRLSKDDSPTTPRSSDLESAALGVINEEKFRAKNQEVALIREERHMYMDCQNLLLDLQSFQALMNDTVATHVSVNKFNKKDLLDIKSRIYEIRDAFASVDFQRRINALKSTMQVAHSELKGHTPHLNGATIMEMVELSDKLLEMQGNCEPSTPAVGDNCSCESEDPGLLSPLLVVYRTLVPKALRKVLVDSGWHRLFALHDDSVANVDMGLNSMGIICALIMTVPFGILSGFNPQVFDELKAAIATCKGTWTDPKTGVKYPITDYGWTFQGIRLEFLCYVSLCIFSSLNAVILSTIYYVFHRGGELDPQKLHGWYRKKGYLIVICCGLCTVLAVGSLFALTKTIYVYFSVSLGPQQPTLYDWWGLDSKNYNISVPFTSPQSGVEIGTTGFFVSDVCSTNSFQFAIPGVFSLIISVFLGLFLVF
jgi:hypothetical protein